MAVYFECLWTPSESISKNVSLWFAIAVCVCGFFWLHLCWCQRFVSLVPCYRLKYPRVYLLIARRSHSHLVASMSHLNRLQPTRPWSTPRSETRLQNGKTLLTHAGIVCLLVCIMMFCSLVFVRIWWLSWISACLNPLCVCIPVRPGLSLTYLCTPHPKTLSLFASVHFCFSLSFCG